MGQDQPDWLGRAGFGINDELAKNRRAVIEGLTDPPARLGLAPLKSHPNIPTQLNNPGGGMTEPREGPTLLLVHSRQTVQPDRA